MQQHNARVAAAIAVGLLFACCFASHYRSTPSKASPHFAKQDRINFAIEQEGRMTADPALGFAPRERLLEARREAADIRAAAENSRSSLAEITWQERGPSNVGGRTRALLIDQNDPSGNTLWAGSIGGGLWKTTNALAENPFWEKTNDALDNLAISTISQSKNEPKILYFGTGEGFFNHDAVRGLGIWKSKNGGITWQRLASTANPDFHFTQKIVCASGQTVLAATRSGGLQRSIDGGQNWAQVLGKNISNCPTDRAADLQISADGTLFAAMGIFEKGGIWRSTDDGENWEKLTTGLPAEKFQRIKIACSPSDPDRLFALLSNDSNYDCLGIWRSDDGGDTWQPMTMPNPLGMNNLCRGMAWYCMAAAVDPNDRDRLIIGGIDLFETTDGGQNWAPISQWYGGYGQPFVHADQHEIVFKPGSSQTFFIGNDGGVFRGKSAAGGGKPDFEFVANGYNVTQYYGCAISPEVGSPLALAGAQDNGTQLFGQNSYQNPLDSGQISQKPAQTVTGGDGGFCHFDRDQPGIQITSYVFSTVNITGDNWATYEQVSIGQGNEGLFINPSAYDDVSNTLFMAFEFNQIALIKDVGGENLPQITPISLNNSYITCLSVWPGAPDCLLLGLSNGDVAKLENASSTSPKVTFLRDGTGWPTCIAIAPSDPNHWLLTYSNYGIVSVFETKNGGTDWLAVEGNLPDMPIRWAVFAPNSSENALLATELGVWATDRLDGEATTWLPANGSMANVRTDMIATRPADGRVIAATHGRGLFETRYFSGENACAQPTGLAVSEVTDSSVMVNWAATGTSDSFEIIFRKTGTTHWKSITCKDFFLKINSLEPATDYEYRVKSFCQNGPSIETASHVFLTKSPVPLVPPNGLRADEIIDNSAILSWENPPGATGFDLRWREKGAANWVSVASFGQNFHFLEDLEPARHYEFSVRSRGKFSPSDWSGAFIFTTASAGSGCPPPNGLLAFEIKPTSAKIRWNSAFEAMQFTVRFKKECGIWQSVTTSDLQVSLTGLTAGERVLFQVKSNCGGETSAWSVLGTLDLPPKINCEAAANAADEWIQSFQLADFQRVTGKNNGYHYFADDPILLKNNRGYDLKIEPGFAGNHSFENYAIWLDLNQNGEFDHPTEQVFARETTKDSLVLGQIFIPENAKPGLTHLRVMMRYSPISGSCGNIAWGEVEDYLVKIEAPESLVGGGFGGFNPSNSGFIDLGEGRGASVFPNPAVDWVKIDFPSTGSATVIDAMGRTLATWPLGAGENDFDVRFLPRGVYSLILVGGRLPVAVRVFKG